MDRGFINKANNHKLILLTLLIAMISVFGVNTIHAKNEGNTEVSFSKEESDAFELSLTATGSGQVKINDIVLRETTKLFMLKVDESMSFKIEPDKGGKVEEVKLNGKNITNLIKNNQIIVSGAEKPQRLDIRFMNIKNQNPSTGIITKTGSYIAVIALSSGVLMYLISKKRKGSQSNFERECEKNVKR